MTWPSDWQGLRKKASWKDQMDSTMVSEIGFWELYEDESGRAWYWNIVSEQCFYEDESAVFGWEKCYCPVRNIIWWCNNSTRTYFHVHTEASAAASTPSTRVVNEPAPAVRPEAQLPPGVPAEAPTRAFESAPAAIGEASAGASTPGSERVEPKPETAPADQASLPRLSHAVGVSHRQRSPRSIEEATDYSAEETMNLIAQSLDAEHRARLRFASQSPANVDQIRKRENELGFLGKDKDGWYVCNVCWPKGKSASTSHLMSWSHVKRTMLYSVRGWNSV